MVPPWRGLAGFGNVPRYLLHVAFRLGCQYRGKAVSVRYCGNEAWARLRADGCPENEGQIRLHRYRKIATRCSVRRTYE